MSIMKKVLILFLLLSGMCLNVLADVQTVTDYSRIDLDLSNLSGTVVYSQVYNLLYDPEPYLEKVIRMSGYYSAFEDTEKNVVYHACVIPDATACCAQGIEFVRAGTYEWPDDYPEDGEDIIVTGRLALYEEDGYMYIHLTDATMQTAGD